jgi:predicted nucleotidyltransferase
MGKYEQKIPELREKIVETLDPEKIILFGSYAWGKPNSSSDVDLLIIQNTQGSRRQKQIELRKKLFKFDVPTDLLVYTQAELDYRLELEDFFFKKIINEGKVIYAK